jgi:hypothetical protein
VSTNAKNKYLDEFKQQGVIYSTLVDGESEGVYLIDTKFENQLMGIMKPFQKGKHNFPNFE